MRSKDYIRFLLKLVALAEEHCRISQGNRNNIEPGFLAVLLYVKNASPELQRKAEKEFAKRVRGLGGCYVKGRASCGLIVYCMRGLKFELVRKAAMEKKNARENASGFLISLRLALGRIIAAYEPGWEKDFYFDYYRRQLPNPKQTLIKYIASDWKAKEVTRMMEFMRLRDAKDTFSKECIIFLRKMMGLAGKRRRLSQGGAEALEPGYFAVLTYVKNATSSMKRMAEREFVNILEVEAAQYVPGTNIFGLIAYCMRELKYKKVRAVAMKLKNAPEYSGRHYLTFRREMEGIIKAYEAK